MNNLQRYAADGAGHHGLFLPQPFGHRQPEALLERLLNNDRRAALKGVDLERRPRRQVQDMDVRVAVGHLFDLFQNRSALGVVLCAPAGQDQLAARNEFLHLLIGLNHADRVLQPVKAGDLGNDGPLGINVEFLQHVANLLRLQFPVLLRQRVDGGVEQVLGNGKLARKIRRGKQRRIVPADELLKKGPDFRVRTGKINMASPDPMVSVRRTRLDQPGRLRVVNHHEILIHLFPLPVPLRVGGEDFKILRLGRIGQSVQGVVEPLGDLEEIIPAGDHVPFRLQAQLVQQGNQAIQNFRHTAADGRRIDHADGLARQRVCQRRQVVDLARPDDGSVILQRLLPCGSFRDYVSGHASTSRTI